MKVLKKYLINKKKLTLSMFDLTTLAIFLGMLIAAQFIDQYAFVVVQPLHLILAALIFSVIGFKRSVFLLSIYGLLFWVLGNLSFIATWQQFVLLWFVGYLLCFYGFYKYIEIYKNKTNWLIYLLTSIWIWGLFILIVVIANSFYISSGTNIGFWKSIASGFAINGNWLTQVVAASATIIILPFFYILVNKKYEQLKANFLKRYNK